MGSTLEVSVDLASTGHSEAVLLVFAQRAEITFPGGQVLLGRERVGTFVGVGPLATFALDVPPDAALCGLSLTLQAVHRAAGRPFALSNAQDLVLGGH